MKVSVSILKEENNIKNVIKKLNDTSADYIHLDIMDNTFTNTKSKYKLSDFINIDNNIKYDIHLMSTDLDYQINEAIKLNPEYITFHLESTNNHQKYIDMIKGEGIKVGLAINPSTDIDDYSDELLQADLILVMSVIPGKGGQTFIDNVIPKIEKIRNRYKNKTISIDGGINDITSKEVFEYVDILVSGNYITSDEEYEKRICLLKKINKKGRNLSMKKNEKISNEETNETKIETELITFENKNKKEKNTRSKNLIKIFFIIVIVVSLFFFIRSKISSNNNIKSLKKILNEEYYNIECLDSLCTEIITYGGNSTGKTDVSLIRSNGDVVAKYITNYDSKSKETNKPYSLGDDFFLSKKIDNSNGKILSYSILDKNGKEIYKTNNELKTINNSLILINKNSKESNSYSIINKSGKVLFDKITNYDIYADKKIISVEVDGNKIIIDENGKKIINNYSIVKEVDDDSNTPLYLIIKDLKKNIYNYFSINSKKIIGTSFQKYEIKDDKSLLVTTTEKNLIVDYSISINGKQKKIGVNKTQTQIINELQKNIDNTNYSVYTSSIKEEKQKYVFVDDLKNNAFGIYDLTNKKFEKLYNYKKDTKNVFSSVYTLVKNDDNNYYQITCTSNSCDKNLIYIYDLTNGKVLFNSVDDDGIIQKYNQYSNNYKVIYYSYSSKNESKKGKFILLDDNNKEIVKSKNGIVVLNEKLLIGNEISPARLLYSTKNKKLLNNDNSLAVKYTINNKAYYGYEDNGYVFILNEKGEELIKEKNIKLITSDKLIVYENKKIINILDTENDKLEKYELNNKENMMDYSLNTMLPYRGAIFINNIDENYFKLVNSKGKIIKKIKGSVIDRVYSNNDVVIITRNSSKKDVKYGLYLAK